MAHQNFRTFRKESVLKSSQKNRKVHGMVWVKIQNKFRQSTQLVESFKTSIYHGDLGVSHGRVGKVTDLHFKGAGSNPGSNLKLSNFYENFKKSM